MRQIHRNSHWLERFLASDPGRKRFQKAGKATISLISSVFTMLFILRITEKDLFPSVLVAAIVGMMSIMAVVDDTKKKKKITTLFMGVSAVGGVTSGSLLAGNAYAVGTLMVLVIFSAFYFSRFGSRYFSLSMIGFITVYISSFLAPSPDQLPWFYLAITIGVTYAFLYNFILFKDSAQVLKRSMRSFHLQTNLTFNILIRVIQHPEWNTKRIKSLEKNVRKLSEYARNVSEDLNLHDVKEIWPGLEPSQLRLYVFDTAMLLETLVDSIHRLKKADAFEVEELKRMLIWVVKSLRDAEVLAQNYQEENLKEAEKAVQGIRLVLNDLLSQENKPGGWLYLIRRMESIANHVVEGATTIQASLHGRKSVREETKSEEYVEEDESAEKEKEQGLKPSTKKAYQALVAGILAIIVGYIISPTQPYWVVLTTFIVLLGTGSVGRIYLKGFQRSFGTVLGAVLGFALAKLVSGHSTLEVILLFLIVFLAFYLVSVSYTLMSLLITMLIAFMYDILLGGISLPLMGARVMDTIAGAGIALGVSAVIFPKKTKHKVADALADFLTELQSYVTSYVRRFREEVNVKELSYHAFDIDQKLQSIKDEAHTLLRRPGALSHTGIGRWITIFTAINYYAKHLVASSYQKYFDYPNELTKDFKHIEEKLDHNIETLSKLITRTERTGVIYNLKSERERIERLAPSRGQSQSDLIHHLYYVWRINQSIVVLGVELGAVEE